MTVNGTWSLSIKTPMGEQKATLSLEQNGAALTGQMSGSMGSVPIENGKAEGDQVSWSTKITSPMPMTLEFSGKKEGANLAGTVKFGAFGSGPFTGTPA
jgi:hypothetical protein